MGSGLVSAGCAHDWPIVPLGSANLSGTVGKTCYAGDGPLKNCPLNLNRDP